MAYPTNCTCQPKKQIKDRKISILEVSNITDRKTVITGTLSELLMYFKPVLESGASCSGAGTRKINTQPESTTSLVTMLNHAKRNLTGKRFDPPTSYRIKRPSDKISIEHVLH